MLVYVGGDTLKYSVGIATGYWLDDQGIGVRVPVESRHVVVTGPGAHPASYPMSTGDTFPGVKPSGREADRSPPAVSM
jgi:hypothetical protein